MVATIVFVTEVRAQLVQDFRTVMLQTEGFPRAVLIALKVPI